MNKTANYVWQKVKLIRLTPVSFLSLIILILIGLLIIEKWQNRNKVSEIKSYYEYRTDTLMAKKYFELKARYGDLTPPITITRWLKPEPGKDGKDGKVVVVEKVPDSIILIIGKLKERLAISDGFIQNYPRNHKLIEFNLNKDSLDITLLNLDGLVSTNKYPIYLDNYEYQWLDNKLTNSKFETTRTKNKLDLSQLYLDTGYDYLTKNNTLGLDYSVKLGRLKVGTDFDMILQETPNRFKVNFTVGYKLLK